MPASTGLNGGGRGDGTSGRSPTRLAAHQAAADDPEANFPHYSFTSFGGLPGRRPACTTDMKAPRDAARVFVLDRVPAVDDAAGALLHQLPGPLEISLVGALPAAHEDRAARGPTTLVILVDVVAGSA